MQPPREEPAATDRPSPESAPMARLEAAVKAYLDYVSSVPRPDPAAFLASNQDLADLLQPMLDESEGQERVAGRSLGDFRLVRELGRGGMGVVYEAWQESLGRRVALKVLTSGFADPRAVARFRREATTSAALEHAGIVKVLAVGEQDDVHFFAMELVDGVPLNRVIKSVEGHDPSTLTGSSIGACVVFERSTARTDETRTQSAELERVWSKGYVETAVGIVLQVAEALHHAHGQGVIHRDVKPSNIMIRQNGSAVLTDFGVARIIDQPGMTRTGEFAGSPHYTSPEQAMAKRMPVDQRSDVFSLGATLYELLTLRLAFPGDTNQEVLTRIVTKDPIEPQKLNPRLAPDLAAITMKALEKDADRRYQTAADLADDLRAFLDYRPVQARQVSIAGMLRRRIRREPIKAALVGVLLIGAPLLLGLGGYVYAKTGAIKAGDALLHADQLDRRLSLAFLQLYEGIPQRAVKAFSDILQDEPDNLEAKVGRILSLLKSNAEGRRAALAEVQAAGPALEPVRRLVLERMARPHRASKSPSDSQSESRAELPPPKTAEEFFLAAMIEVERGERGVAGAFGKAYEMLHQALLRAERSRRYHVTQLVHVAGHLGDRSGVARYSAALESLWPDDGSSKTTIGIAYERCEPKRAEAILQAALTVRPDDGDALAALGRSLAHQYRYAEAEQTFRRALALGESRSVLSGLADSLINQDKCQEARQHVAKILKRDARDPGAHVQMGVADLRQRNWAGATEWACKALAIEPDQSHALSVLGLAQLKLGALEEAETHLRRVCDEHPTAVAYTQMARVYSQTKRPMRAIHACERALAMETRDPRIRAEALLHKGTAHGSLNQLDAAVACYEEGAVLWPESVDLWCALATAYLLRNDIAKVKETASKALALDPERADAIGILGRVHELEGRTDDAVASYRRALSKPVPPWTARLWLGILLSKGGKTTEAIELLESVTKENPDEISSRSHLASAYESAGDMEAAEECHEKVLQVQPNNTLLTYGYGAFLFRRGRRDEALEMFRRTVALDPKHALGNVNAGQILLGTGYPLEALPYLRRAHALRGKDGSWRYPTAQWIRMAEQKLLAK